MWFFRKKKEVSEINHFKNKTMIDDEVSHTHLLHQVDKDNLKKLKITSKTADNNINSDIEEFLHFDNLNFKLSIIQVLMYDLGILEPCFDIYNFSEQYSEEEIDTESESIIKPALNYFEHLLIPSNLAIHIEEIYMDGGNDIYMNIIPLWDGEDDSFDLDKVSLKELSQFPNLKKATIMSSNFENVKEVFESLNIEVEML